MSEYYTHTTYPAPGVAGASSAMRAELDAITTGFDLLPAIAGKEHQVVKVNSAGSALESSKTLQSIQKVHGTISSGTENFAYSDGNYHTVTNGGAFTITTSAWPTTTLLAWMTLKITNGGAFTITWPTINWVKPDGSTTTTFATYMTAIFTTLQTSGVNFIVLWSDNAGTTIYGKMV